MIAFFLLWIVSTLATLMAYHRHQPSRVMRCIVQRLSMLMLGLILLSALILLVSYYFIHYPILYVINPYVNFLNSIHFFLVEALAGVIAGYLFGLWLYSFHIRFVDHQHRRAIHGSDIVIVSLITLTIFIMLIFHPDISFSSIFGRVKSLSTPFISADFRTDKEQQYRNMKTDAPGRTDDSAKPSFRATFISNDLRFLAYAVSQESDQGSLLNQSSNNDIDFDKDHNRRFIMGYFFPFVQCSSLPSDASGNEQYHNSILNIQSALFSLLTITENPNSHFTVKVEDEISKFIEAYEMAVMSLLISARRIATIEHKGGA